MLSLISYLSCIYKFCTFLAQIKYCKPYDFTKSSHSQELLSTFVRVWSVSFLGLGAPYLVLEITYSLGPYLVASQWLFLYWATKFRSAAHPDTQTIKIQPAKACPEVKGSILYIWKFFLRCEGKCKVKVVLSLLTKHTGAYSERADLSCPKSNRINLFHI